MNLSLKNTPGALLVLIGFIAGCIGRDAVAAERGARSPEQLAQMLQRFPEADADKDGKLTMEEARAYFRKLKSDKPPEGGTPSTSPPAAAAKPPEGGTPNTSAPATAAKPPEGGTPNTSDRKAKRGKYDKDAGPKPDLEDVPYGEHERLKLDLWKAKSEQPTPILVFFHGGGGDKLMYRGSRLMQFCLQNGISAAAVNYRPNNQFPFPVPMQDAGRAIQFLRREANEFHLDPKRVAATGTSLGANVSIWLAYHDDIANPQSDDPVLRESSRLSFVISGAGQTFNDMELYRQRVYPYNLPDVEKGISREKAREISAIYHVTKDDPPILMTYGIALQELPLPKDTPIGDLIHNPAFGLLLKEKLDEVGIENQFYHGGNRAPADAQEKFVLKHFFGGAAPSP